MHFKKFLSAYLSFSRCDRLGVIALSFLILIIYFLPLWFPASDERPVILQTMIAEAADSLIARQPEVSNEALQKPTGAHLQQPIKPFPFDPNSLQADGWKALGLPDRTVRTLMNYRNKGGRFRKKEDLQKIWGLPPGFYEKVQAYIVFQNQETPSMKDGNKPVILAAADHHLFKQRTIEKVSINSSDSLAWIALPGIGSRLAARIIAFREKLGGFYSVDQVAEVYGIADSVFRRIKPYLVQEGAVRKFNINSVSKDELKLHPYIKWKLAQAIVEYRNQHGSFQSLDELRHITLIDEIILAKLLPYLSL
jgi:DNA uptake protein ComE-like DNA-binding protein